MSFCGVLVTGVGGVSGRKSEFSAGLGMMTVEVRVGVSSARLATAVPGLRPKIFPARFAGAGSLAGGACVVAAGGAADGVAFTVLLMMTTFCSPDLAGGSVV